jgi:hypothetical protein
MASNSAVSTPPPGSTVRCSETTFTSDGGNPDCSIRPEITTYPSGAINPPAPGNLISRFILGLQPITPGFGHVLIQPHLGTMLTYMEGVVPTIRGPVGICASNAPGDFQLRLDIPGNVTANVMLPAFGATNPVALVDGKAFPGAISNNWMAINNIGAGSHSIWLSTNSLSSGMFYARRAASSFHTNIANRALQNNRSPTAAPSIDLMGTPSAKESLQPNGF